MKVALYPRVSTQEQAKEGYSIGEQIERMQQYCALMNWDVYRIYTDPGFSGGNTNRPGLQALIADVKAGKVEKVVVYKLDRLSRSQLDTLYLIEKVFLANNVDFVSISEQFDTGTPFGKAMIGILAVFAQLEREQIKERMKLGRDARAKEGKYHGGGKLPIGYDYVDGQLIVNPYEALQIQKIYQYTLEGLNPYAIVRKLEDGGYKHHCGNWSDITVRNVLRSRIYIGYIQYGGNYYQGLHEPIIKESDYWAVQEIMKTKSVQYSVYNRRPGKSNTYLGGFLYCKQCGAKYSKFHVTVKKNDKFYEYNKYTCNSRSARKDYLVKNRSCKNKHWEVDELTNLVFDEIRKLALEPDLITNLSEEKGSEESAILQAEIEKVDKQISKYLDLYSLDEIPVKILQDKIIELNQKKEALEDEIEKIRILNQSKTNRSEALQAVQSFNEVLENGTFEEIRSILTILIEKIELDNDDIDIHWNFI